MTREKLSALIDRAVGTKGILRIPAYWMRKILNAIISYLEPDASVSFTSAKAVQNKVIRQYVDEKTEIYYLPDSFYSHLISGLGAVSLSGEYATSFKKAINNIRRVSIRMHSSSEDGFTLLYPISVDYMNIAGSERVYIRFMVGNSISIITVEYKEDNSIYVTSSSISLKVEATS